MKLLSFMFALFCAGAAFAKADPGFFNQAVRESIKQEMKKDGEAYKKEANRAPASVSPSESEKVQSEQKSLDKVEKHYKQLGRPSW